MAIRKQFKRGKGEGKKRLAPFSSTRFSLTQARNDSQQLFQLVLIVTQPARKARVSIALCGPLGLFGGWVLRWTSRSPAESTLRKWYLQNEQAHLISGLVPGKFQVLLRSIWCTALAVDMCAAENSWSSPRHISELREWVIWSQTILIIAGHSLLHDMAYYKLTSSTTHV